MCAACERREPYVASAWFSHLWFLYRLQRGGCPFAIDDLTPEEWMALADLKDELEAERELAMAKMGAPSYRHG